MSVESIIGGILLTLAVIALICLWGGGIVVMLIETVRVLTYVPPHPLPHWSARFIAGGCLTINEVRRMERRPYQHLLYCCGDCGCTPSAAGSAGAIRIAPDGPGKFCHCTLGSVSINGCGSRMCISRREVHT